MGEQQHVIMRRVAGQHDIRLDGISDLLGRARGASVMDVGCNRGLVGFEFAKNGAALVHGCDNYEQGIMTAREIFADLRAVKSQFEVVDLRGGGAVLKPFNGQRYTITVMLATYHKLKRVMSAGDLSELMRHIGARTTNYFAWRGTSDKAKENEQEMVALDRDLGEFEFHRVQTSTISDLGLAAIWARA